MKNIAIFGSSRAGKSTLSKMIVKKYPQYHVIIGDDVRGAFEEVFPKMEINSKNGQGMKEDFPNFISTLFYKNIKSNSGEFHYIIETCDVEPKKAKELFSKENTQIIFLGVPRRTEEEHIRTIRDYETERDWTYNRTEEEIERHAKTWIQKSKQFEKECKELGILFIDTSKDRENKLKEAMELLFKEE